MRHDHTSRARDRGSSAIEAAILAPALIAILMFAIAAMRIEVASQSVDSAAHDAARAASISNTATEAKQAALKTADARLAAQGLQCRTLDVNVDVSQFGRPVGTVAAVTVTIVCVVELRDVAVPGMPGSKTLTSRFVSYLDQYRSRS
jgi:Flp pilus assembly protein TadG